MATETETETETRRTKGAGEAGGGAGAAGWKEQPSQGRGGRGGRGGDEFGEEELEGGAAGAAAAESGTTVLARPVATDGTFQYVTPPSTPPAATNRKCPGAPKRSRWRPARREQRDDDDGMGFLGVDERSGSGEIAPRNLFGKS